jgi:hypothetical protein
MELNQGTIYHYDGVFTFLLERLYLIGPIAYFATQSVSTFFSHGRIPLITAYRSHLARQATSGSAKFRDH